jgi:hypothetical protein
MNEEIRIPRQSLKDAALKKNEECTKGVSTIFEEEGREEKKG